MIGYGKVSQDETSCEGNENITLALLQSVIQRNVTHILFLDILTSFLTIDGNIDKLCVSATVRFALEDHLRIMYATELLHKLFIG